MNLVLGLMIVVIDCRLAVIRIAQFINYQKQNSKFAEDKIQICLEEPFQLIYRLKQVVFLRLLFITKTVMDLLQVEIVFLSIAIVVDHAKFEEIGV